MSRSTNKVNNYDMLELCKQLIEFLTVNNAYDDYVAAIVDQHATDSVMKRLDAMSRRFGWNPYECIDFGFTWRNAPGGDNRWCAIDTKWRTFLKSAGTPKKKYKSIW